MSVDRNIDIDFSIKFTNDDIKSILQKALNLGCYLYKTDPKTHNQLSFPLEEMASMAFEGYNTPRVGGGFCADLDSTSLIISFYQNFHGTASLGLMLGSNYWEKDFGDDEIKCDFARYVRFILNISKNLPIKSIKISYE